MEANKEVKLNKFPFLSILLSWVKKNKKDAIILFIILLLAFILRVWRLDEYLPFLGDEGRDVRVVRRFVTEFDLMFIGPRTSIGDMYLGPLYYYLISPFLAVWGLSPVGPAFFVALLSTITVWFIWFVSRTWFGKVAGVTSSFLFAISPVVINQAKHSWNPNIMPFFALLAIFSAWKVWDKKDYKWIIVLGIAFGTIIQSHYLGLLLAPTIFIVLLGSIIFDYKKSINLRKFVIFSFAGLLSFILLISPLFFFDYKHGWQNLGSMETFFVNRQTTVSAKPWNALPEMWPLWHEQLITRLVTAKNAEAGFAISVTLLCFFGYYIWIYYKKKRYSELSPILIIGMWGFFGILGLGLYKQSIYDHYFGFLFPLPFLMIGFVAEKVWNKEGKIFVIITLGALVFLNIAENPLKYPPQRQMYKVQDINKSILEDSLGKPFNFGLISKRNYEEGYLYYFELWKSNIKLIDPQNTKETITDQLYVVCEDPICEPINNPKAEIASFGWQKIEKEWNIYGTKIFKIVHTESKK